MQSAMYITNHPRLFFSTFAVGNNIFISKNYTSLQKTKQANKQTKNKQTKQTNKNESKQTKSTKTKQTNKQKQKAGESNGRTLSAYGRNQ
jgi:flagellar biosynthesis component FlhA